MENDGHRTVHARSGSHRLAINKCTCLVPCTVYTFSVSSRNRCHIRQHKTEVNGRRSSNKLKMGKMRTKKKTPQCNALKNGSSSSSSITFHPSATSHRKHAGQPRQDEDKTANRVRTQSLKRSNGIKKSTKKSNFGCINLS